MRFVTAQAGIAPALPGLPAGVHAMKRGEAYVLVNGATPSVVALPWRATDHLSGKTSKTLRLGSWGVAVLTKA